MTLLQFVQEAYNYLLIGGDEGSSDLLHNSVQEGELSKLYKLLRQRSG